MQTQIHFETMNPSPPSASEVAAEVGPSERLRVLHVIPRLGMGGTEHGVLKVMTGLGEEEFEQRICAVRGMDATFADQMNVAAKTYLAGSPRAGFQFPLFRLAKIMRQFRPHIVHTRNFGALEGVAAARMARVPVAIHSEHGYELEIMKGLPFRRRVLCRALFGMTDAVFTVTADLRDYHAKQSWLAARKISVIHNGVNTNVFSPRPECAQQTREALQIPQDRLVIGSVGRLVPIKDHATLLRAAELLVRQGKNIHLLIVGSGPEQTKLDAYAAASPELAGRTTFTGSSDRVAQLLNAMDVFALPSINEGMSNTLLEAMACGLPIVATKAGGNSELADEGRSAYLFPVRDVHALSQILGRLVDAPEIRSVFGKAARLRALQQFSLANMVEQYRGLYLRLASLRGFRKRN
jgi:sugar transferase (PEP-CTERM/EpsH1 system associated)